MNCEQVEEQLARYVDGVSVDNAAAIAAHLETCAECRGSAHAQRVARTVLRARAADLAPMAPPGLRTRILAHASDSRTSSPRDLTTFRPQDLGWTGRLTAFAMAAMFVLTVGAVLLPVTTIRSTALLAAQLALDHLKCFTIEGDADGQPISKAQAEAALRQEYGLDVTVPASRPGDRLELMAVRRCLYGDGRAAHLMYRLNGEPVSLFVIPGLSRPAADLSLFGHDQVVWAVGDRTYMLVARGGLRDQLARVA
ncbi:MAG TPA: zf-HC2 domain-containing protein, partial [Vicinamibacterales bacterium]|nr:zf-HC2 domain-containing protein [Vicinamibacterales bacterium]